MTDNYWHVRLSKKAEKSLGKLPKPVLQTLTALMHQIEKSGPVRGDWSTTASSAPNGTIVMSRREDQPMWQFGRNWNPVFR